MVKKRVACLWRVSTKKQLQSKKKKRGNEVVVLTPEEEMELQRKESMRFIKEMEPEGWEYTGIDYIEGGVSAFRTHTSKRKEVMRALEDARNGVYDILLVYKLDRFGRRSSESLSYAQKFERFCEIWVVDKRRQFRSNGSMEELIAFIEFWHAKQSSEDTKVRVRDAMRQIHEMGLWTGGNPPYGYRNHPSKENMLEQDPLEAEVVKIIYDLYAESGNYGYSRIANYLNQSGKYKPRIVEQWSTTTISSILKNPIYKGYLSYGKTTSKEGEWGIFQSKLPKDEWSISEKKWDEYIIVSEELWNKAQEVRKGRRNAMNEKGILKKSSMPVNNVSPLLLSGIATCGYCGGSMVMQHETKKKKRDGSVREVPLRYTNYKCLNRTKRGKSGCDGEQIMYRQSSVEDSVIPQLKMMMESLSRSHSLKNIFNYSKSRDIQVDVKLSQLQQSLKQWERAKLAAEQMIDDVLMGKETLFDVSTLNDRLKNAISKIQELNQEILDARNNDELGKKRLDEFLRLTDFINKWSDSYDEADFNTKKQMIMKVVDKVVVTKGNVAIELNLKLKDMVSVLTVTKTTKENKAN